MSDQIAAQSKPHLAWHHIDRGSYVNGPGPRTVLWLTGCPIHCPGCQNRALWNESEGTRRTSPAELARDVALLAGAQDLTITGGEPFFQPEALGWFLIHLRNFDEASGRRRRHVVVYTGYTWEDLHDLAEAFPAIRAVLSMDLIDVLVDGPYLKAQDDDLIQWRGSRNQRVIDVKASVANGALVRDIVNRRGDPDFDGRLVLLDWDTPTLTLTPDGQLVGAAGLIRELSLAAEVSTAPRCGEVALS